jgi:hypothetical protein
MNANAFLHSIFELADRFRAVRNPLLTHSFHQTSLGFDFGFASILHSKRARFRADTRASSLFVPGLLIVTLIADGGRMDRVRSLSIWTSSSSTLDFISAATPDRAACRLPDPSA